MQIDYVALARIGLLNPDHKPDGSGLDDGPPIRRSVINHRKKELAILARQRGGTLRAIGADLGVTFETVRVWTKSVRHTPTPQAIGGESE